MSQLTLELPQSLQDELELLAGDEGVSLERYIMYTLTQKVTLARVAFSRQQAIELTPEQVRLLAYTEPVSDVDMQRQTDAFAQLRTRLGPPASEDEVREFLATREVAVAEPDLNPDAAARFREKFGL